MSNVVNISDLRSKRAATIISIRAPTPAPIAEFAVPPATICEVEALHDKMFFDAMKIKARAGLERALKALESIKQDLIGEKQ